MVLFLFIVCVGIYTYNKVSPSSDEVDGGKANFIERLVILVWSGLALRGVYGLCLSLLLDCTVSYGLGWNGNKEENGKGED